MSEEQAFSEAERAAAYDAARYKIAQAKVEHSELLNLNSIVLGSKPRALTTLLPVTPVR
ncbi:MAG: hypothetical protein AAFP68_20295 [Pseudomonadota bacterium]